ncbi:MAG: hypothetical protein WC692_07620 [Erythrobacter sp.]|jgi:hypothetical protein
MASFIISQPMPDRFEHHLREAIETLGYYRIDALEQLLAMYRDRWPRGLSSSMFRLSEIQPLLSEKGLSDPYHVQKATHLRAYFNLSREQFDDQEPHWSQLTSQVTFAACGQWLCEDARRLNGAVMPAGDRWPLPLPECAQEWCPCRWDLVTDPL